MNEITKYLTDQEVIARAAELLAARHQNSALAPILEAQMLHVIQQIPTSAGVGYVHWIAALQALGEIILSIAKQEARKAKSYDIK